MNIQPTAPSWLVAIREEIDRAYARVEREVGDGTAILIGCPTHSNPGDNAIWIAQIAILRRLLGERLVICTHTAQASDLVARMPGGNITILLHGGGNFGDLWPGHQNFRLSLMHRFPELSYIQLPQSLHFASDETSRKTRLVLGRVRRFLLLVRERDSLELAQRLLDVEVLLCPDSAFALTPVMPRMTSLEETLIVRRGDRESLEGTLEPSPGAVEYLTEPRMPLWPRIAGRIGRMSLLPSSFANRVALPFGETVPATRYRHGIELLSRYRRVESDFLHVHVLASLLGIEHTIIAGAYHKNRSVWETWTHRVPHASFRPHWSD